MIIKAFSDYLKEFSTDIPPTILLTKWLKDKLSKPVEDNISKVIHEELALGKNKKGFFILVGKSKTGRILIESLYNFALSYEQQNFTRWVHKVKASDFKE
jgi:hypothetical protein